MPHEDIIARVRDAVTDIEREAESVLDAADFEEPASRRLEDYVDQLDWYCWRLREALGALMEMIDAIEEVALDAEAALPVEEDEPM